MTDPSQEIVRSPPLLRRAHAQPAIDSHCNSQVSWIFVIIYVSRSGCRSGPAGRSWTGDETPRLVLLLLDRTISLDRALVAVYRLATYEYKYQRTADEKVDESDVFKHLHSQMEADVTFGDRFEIVESGGTKLFILLRRKQDRPVVKTKTCPISQVEALLPAYRLSQCACSRCETICIAGVLVNDLSNVKY